MLFPRVLTKRVLIGTVFFVLILSTPNPIHPSYIFQSSPWSGRDTTMFQSFDDNPQEHHHIPIIPLPPSSVLPSSINAYVVHAIHIFIPMFIAKKVEHMVDIRGMLKHDPSSKFYWVFIVISNIVYVWSHCFEHMADTCCFLVVHCYFGVCMIDIHLFIYFVVYDR